MEAIQKCLRLLFCYFILEALVALVWRVLFADVSKRGKNTSSVGVSLPSEIPQRNIMGDS